MKKRLLHALLLLTGFSTSFFACSDDSSSKSSGEEVYATFDDLPHCGKSRRGDTVYVESESVRYTCTEDGWIIADDGEGSSASSEDTTKVETVPVDSATVLGFAQKGPFVDGSTVTITGVDSLLESTKEKFSGKISGDSGAYSVSGVTLQNQYALVTANGFFFNGVSGKKTTGSKTKLSALADLTDTSAAGNAKVNVNIFSQLEYARVVNLVTGEKYNVPAAKRRATKELLAAFGRGYPDSVSAESSLVATATSLQDTGYVGASLYAAGIMMVADLNPAKIASRINNVSKDFAEDGLFNDSNVRASIADYLSSADSADNYASIRKNVQAWKLASPVPDFESILRAFWTSEFGLPECTDSLETHIEKNKNKNSASHDDGFACTSQRWHRVSALDAALGLCTGSKEGSFAKLDSAKEYYTCAMGVWQEISETAYNLKECTFDREGEYVSEGGEYFVCVARQWKEIDSVSYELKICTHDRYGEYAKTKKGFYRCINSVWEEITEVDYTLKTCSSENAGEKATVEDDYYLCREGAWEKIDAVSYELGLCEESIEGTLDETKAFERYVCDKSEDSWAWRKLTESEAEFGICTQAKEGLAKESSSGDFVACSGGKWIEADETSAYLGVLCQESLENEVRWYGASVSYDDTEGVIEDPSQAYYFEQNVFPAKDAKFFECHNGKWETSTGIRWLYGANCAENIMNSYISAEYDEQIGLHFNYSDSSFATVLLYTLVKTSTLATFGYDLLTNSEGDTLLYAICKNKDWEKISQDAYEQQEVCSESNLDKQSNGYKCTADGWVRMSVEDLELGECNYDLKDSMVLGYVCQKTSDTYTWREATTAERATGTVCKWNTDKYKIIAGYVCQNGADGKYTWRNASAAEKATGKVCLGSSFEVEKGYVCEDGAWRNASAAEKATGKVCGSGLTAKDTLINNYVCEVTLTPSYDKIYTWRNASTAEKATGRVCHGSTYKIEKGYVCEKSTWREATTVERSTGEVCYSKTYTKNGPFAKHGYICDSSGWRQPTALEKRFGKACTNIGTKSLNELIDSDTVYYCKSEVGKDYAGERGKGWLKYATGDIFNKNGESFDVIVVDSVLWMNKNITRGGTYCYNKKEENCLTDGALFSEGSKSFCPDSSWTPPTTEQFRALLNSEKTFSIQLSGYCKINKFYSDGSVKEFACYKKGKQATLWLYNDGDVNNVQWEGKSWVYDYSNYEDYRYKPLRCIKELF